MRLLFLLKIYLFCDKIYLNGENLILKRKSLLSKNSYIKILISIIFTAIILFFSHFIWLETEGSYTSFKFDVFFIILVLSFALFYKISKYIIEFKTVKNCSKADIFLLAIFFIFLFLPMSNINKGEVSETENRNLAKWKRFINDDGTLNLAFGVNFEKYFNDRFFLRDALVTVYQYIYFINNTYQTKSFMIDKVSGFCFSKIQNSEKIYLKTDVFTEQELKIIKDNFKKIAKLYKQNDIDLYVVLENDKESLYPEYYPKFYLPKKGVSRLEQLEGALQGIDNLTIIVPSYDLMKAKEQGTQIFLKTDTQNGPHDKNIYKMQTLASLIQYEAIVKGLSKKYQSLKPIERSRYKKEFKKDFSGNIINKLHIRKYFSEDVELYVLKNPEAKYKRASGIENYKNPNAQCDKKVLLVGDSFIGRYKALLAENFTDFKALYIKGERPMIIGKEQKQILKNSKPDIVIIEATERFLQKFAIMDLDFFDTK